MLDAREKSPAHQRLGLAVSWAKHLSQPIRDSRNKSGDERVLWSESCQDDRSTTVPTASIDGFPIEICLWDFIPERHGKMHEPQISRL